MNTSRSLGVLSLAGFNFGVLRAEYTLGAAGYSKRATCVVTCPGNGSDCFAGGGRTEIQ